MSDDLTRIEAKLDEILGYLRPAPRVFPTGTHIVGSKTQCGCGGGGKCAHPSPSLNAGLEAADWSAFKVPAMNDVLRVPFPVVTGELASYSKEMVKEFADPRRFYLHEIASDLYADRMCVDPERATGEPEQVPVPPERGEEP